MAYIIYASPLNAEVRADFLSNLLICRVDYLIHWPKRREEVQISFDEIAWVALTPRSWSQPDQVEVLAKDGTRVILRFSNKRPSGAEKFAQQLQSALKPPAASLSENLAVEADSEAMAPAPVSPLMVALVGPTAAVTAAESVKNATLFSTRSAMARELQSWAKWSLGLGVLQMIAAGGFSFWGAVLILVGLASFYFQESSMFVIYGVTVGWAGISNVTSGDGKWMFFALLQAYFAFQIFRQFLRFRKAEVAALSSNLGDLPTGRAERFFPWVALGTGLLALFLSYGGFLTGVVVVIVSELEGIPNLFLVLMEIGIHLGVLALAVGLSAWLCRYKYRGASIAGFVMGVLTLLGYGVLILFSSMG